MYYYVLYNCPFLFYLKSSFRCNCFLFSRPQQNECQKLTTGRYIKLKRLKSISEAGTDSALHVDS